MNASDLFVRALENEGVEYVFGVPGEENLDLLEALRRSRIRLVTTRHEQTAGFMAATVGRLTGRAGVCLSTLGPGATNLVTPAAYAQLGGMPMLMITGQKPVLGSKQGHFQIVRTSDILAPVTKLTKVIIAGRSIPSLVREAFRRADEERPGAVHLELPEDIAREDVLGGVLSVHSVRRPVAEAKAVARAVEMLERARRPLIVIGAGANRKLTSKMLAELVAKTGIPFVSTQMGKGVVDERSPLCLGAAALSDGDFVHCAIARADLILNVGHDVVEKPPFIMNAEDRRAVIHVNFYGAQVDEIYFPEHEVVGDIANALWQIKEAVEPQPHWDFAPLLAYHDRLVRHVEERAMDEAFPVLPQRLVADVRAAMPEDGIVALDNGMYKIWFARNYQAYQRQTLLLDNALATMGAGLPSAMAAKLVHPERRVLAVCGDGGFLMNSQDLETAVRLGLDLVVLIVNDNGYGMIRWKQQAMRLPDYGLDFGNPDFVAYAKAYGAEGRRIGSAEELLPAITEAFEAGGVHVIDVPVDYSENDRVLSKEIKQMTCIL